MHQLDLMIARLRLLLAETSVKEQQLGSLRRQLREQLDRLLSYSLYGEGDLDRSLALMADVEQRLAQAEMSGRHVQRIRQANPTVTSPPSRGTRRGPA